MKELKIQAFALRKKGKSYKQISQSLNVNKSTLSYWFKGIDWSNDIKKQLSERERLVSKRRLIHLNKLKKLKWDNHYLKAQKEALTEFDMLKNDSLFITGVSLYWGEGDKVFKNGNVRISNVEATLLYVFVKFLENVCKVSMDKIKASVLIYPDVDSNDCLKFWRESLCLPKERFCKATLIKGKHKTRRLAHGVCSVYVCDKYLKKKILVWLDLFSNSFIKRV